MRDMHRRRRTVHFSEFLAGFVGSQAAMTPPSASEAIVEAQPLIARLLKPPKAAITETMPCAHSLESAAPCRCIEKSKLNPRQRHTKKVLVQRSSGYIAIMSFVGRASLSQLPSALHRPKDCALTLRSSRRVPAGRFRPSFHSRPYAPCLHARLNSNVSAQKRPQFKRSSPPCKVGESMLNTRSSSQASSVRERP